MTEKMPELEVHEKQPPFGYSWIGFFKTQKEAEKWYHAALNAGKKNPFWLEKLDLPAIYGKNTYSLWWKKPKSSKMAGRGFVAGNHPEKK